jgi:hypothetical protein
MALLIYAVVATLLLFTALRTRSRFSMLLLQVLPVLFLFVFFWVTRDGYRVLQIRKLGYEFDRVSGDYHKPARTVTIGGDRDGDAVFVGDLPGSAVRITPSLVDGSSRVEVNSGGVLLFRNDELLNRRLLEDGDVLSAGDRKLTFHSRGAFSRRFESAGRSWSWPRKAWKENRVRQPFFMRSLQSEYFFLSDVGDSVGVPFPLQGALSKEDVEFSFSRQMVRINRVVLSAYDPSIRINGEQPPVQFTCGNGDVLRMYSIGRHEGSVRLRQAAAFRISNAHTLSLVYTVPQTLGMKEDLFRQGTSDKPLLISTSTLPYSIFPTAHYAAESRTFSDLSAFVQAETPGQPGNRLEEMKGRITRALSMEKRRFVVVTEDGTYRPANGEAIPLGKENSILFSISELRYPWLLLQAALILFLLKALFQLPFFSPMENMPAALMLSVVDFFLVTRLLFAFRAAGLYPFSAEVVPGALMAILVVPYLLFLVLMFTRRDWGRPHLFSFIGYVLAAPLAAHFVLPSQAWAVDILSLAACAIAFLRYHPRSPLPRLTARFRPRIPAVRPPVALGLFLALAAVLQLLGAGEAVRIAGIRFPLSLLYHPLFLLFSCAWLWRIKQGLLQKDERYGVTSFLKSYGGFLLVMVAFLAVSFLISDLGFFLLFCLPVLFLLAGAALLFFREYELRWKAAGALLLVPLAAFLLIFSSYSTISRVLPPSLIDQPVVQRILLAVDPSILEQSGVIATERQLGHQRAFLAYAHSGINGGGYMGRPITSALTRTALNDNVPSVFLLSDFGVLGLAGALLILIVCAWLRYRAAPASSEEGENSMARLLSLAALLTLLFADIYMIFANAGIFLFTGKNVFLWGLNSNSDVLHSVILFAFLMAPLAQIRPAEMERTDPTLTREKLGLETAEGAHG